MPKPQYNDRKEALSGLELEKALFDASERVAKQMFSGLLPERGLDLSIDLWELENLLLPILNAVVNEIRIFDESKAEDFSFELKRRRNSIPHDLVNMLIECFKDAYRDGVEVEYSSAKLVSIRFLKGVGNLSAVKKEFSNRVYELFRHLLGK
ncbi:MAG: hypothetical protein QFX35_01780 [Candidatus Verstraetearchaeota archaeon]|nr:hypothetical protein [Candidatus Verstraetearchaeota archaeon]